MKKLFFFLIISLFLINSVFALDCQYRINESYEIFELGLYNSEGEYMGLPLEFREFSGGSFNLYGCSLPSFKIYNTLKTDITLNVSYSTSWNKAIGGAVSQPHQTEISISKYSESDKIFGTCIDIGSGSIFQESIKYLITEPELITLENELVTKQREICKICPNGKQCLDDGALCSLDTECGSNVCNPDKRCGTFNGCSDGKKLCNQSNLCLTPSVKEVGEAYTCEWECKSDRFENGICLKSTEQIQTETEQFWKRTIIFGVFVFILVLVIFLWIEIKKRRKVRNETDEIIKEKERLIAEIKKLRKDIENLKKEIEEINLLIKEGKDKIVSLKDKIKETEGRAKEELERRLKIEEERQKNWTNRLQSRKEKLLQEEKEIVHIEKELSNKKNDLTKEINEIIETSPERRRKKLENYYNSKYGHRNTKVFYDDERKSFRIRYPDRKVYDLYWKIYRDNIDSNLIGKHVHHINYDEEIDELWNLIALSEKDHNKIKHYNIDKGNWESGIKEIKRALNWEDSDFPEHIWKEIDIREKQKKLEKYAKRSFRRRR